MNITEIGKIIGMIVEMLITLPMEQLETIHKLLEKLTSEADDSGQMCSKELKHFVAGDPCWVKRESSQKLNVISPVEPGESIDGYEFVRRSAFVARELGMKLLDETDYDFYRREENWALLILLASGDKDVHFIQESENGPKIYCLNRNDQRWDEIPCNIDTNSFFDRDIVAVAEL
ncbi:MAG: hypothetical protein WCV55_02520 [Candidatus Paceibacterota bacterium]